MVVSRDKQKTRNVSKEKKKRLVRSITHGDSGKQALGHVGDNDADEEDDSVEPVVAEDEGDDEEGDTEEDGDAGDDVDEVGNFLGNGRLASLQAGGQAGDAAHDRVVADLDDQALACSWKEKKKKIENVQIWQNL